MAGEQAGPCGGLVPCLVSAGGQRRRKHPLAPKTFPRLFLCLRLQERANTAGTGGAEGTSEKAMFGGTASGRLRASPCPAWRLDHPRSGPRHGSPGMGRAHPWCGTAVPGLSLPPASCACKRQKGSGDRLGTPLRWGQAILHRVPVTGDVRAVPACERVRHGPNLGIKGTGCWDGVLTVPVPSGQGVNASSGQKPLSPVWGLGGHQFACASAEVTLHVPGKGCEGPAGCSGTRPWRLSALLL